MYKRLKDKDEFICSTDSLKLLGFNFSNLPNAAAHVKTIVKKVHQRSWTIINLKKAGLCNEDVQAVYKSVIRSVMDFACTIDLPFVINR